MVVLPPIQPTELPKTPEQPIELRFLPAELRLVAATSRELEAAGVLDSVAGQQAMCLAAKMSSGYDTGSALAAASKELRTVMAEALKDVTKKADSLDELMARRLRRASGG